MESAQNALQKKERRRNNSFNIIFYFLFTVFALICAYPFYYLLIATVSDTNMVDTGRVVLFPIGLTFKNYRTIFGVQNLLHAAEITVLRTVLGTALSLFCTSYMAYFFTKREMWGHKFWYRMVIATMYFSAGLIPSYLNNRMLGLINSFWIYIIPGLISTYNMILIKTSMEALPAELEESAYLDGAGYFRRLFLIVLPLQKPILATVALFLAVGHWNDFFTTKLYITNPNLYTLQFLLYELLNQITSASSQIDMADPDAVITPTGIRLTLTAVVTIPILCVYPFVQKYYVKGIMVGAVKG